MRFCNYQQIFTFLHIIFMSHRFLYFHTFVRFNHINIYFTFD